MYLKAMNRTASESNNVPANTSGYTSGGFSVSQNASGQITGIKFEAAANNPVNTNTSYTSIGAYVEPVTERVTDPIFSDNDSEVYVGNLHDTTEANIDVPDAKRDTDNGQAAVRVVISNSSSASQDDSSRLDVGDYDDISEILGKQITIIAQDRSDFVQTYVTGYRVAGENSNTEASTQVIYLTDTLAAGFRAGSQIILGTVRIAQTETGLWALYDNDGTLLASN